MSHIYDYDGVTLGLGEGPREVLKSRALYMPLGRRMELEELVGAAVYLASSSAVATTGHFLIVDGGWTAR